MRISYRLSVTLDGMLCLRVEAEAKRLPDEDGTVVAVKPIRFFGGDDASSRVYKGLFPARPNAILQTDFQGHSDRTAINLYFGDETLVDAMIFPAAFSVLLAAVAVAAPSPQSSPVPQDLINKVHIGNIVMGGSGCPQGSVSAAFSPDNTTMTLIFDNWEAQWYTTPAAAHENCQLNIEIFVPFGIAFFVASIDHRGYALLDSGCTGSVSTTYYFSGETQQVRRP